MVDLFSLALNQRRMADKNIPSMESINCIFAFIKNAKIKNNYQKKRAHLFR